MFDIEYGGDHGIAQENKSSNQRQDILNKNKKAQRKWKLGRNKKYCVPNALPLLLGRRQNKQSAQ